MEWSKYELVSLLWVTYPNGRWSHCDGWPTQKNDGEGSKAHSKGGRVRKRTTWEVRAQRRTQKEVGLATHYLRDGGSKAHSKWGRVRKHTTWEVRAQRRTQKEVRAQRRTQNEVELENALPKKMVAQRRTRNEVGLENTLPEKKWYVTPIWQC